MDVQTHQGGGEGTARFVLLTTVGDVNTARLLAARLSAEGIETRLHGDALGPYPVTVGSLAETQLWVLSDRVAEASELLLDAEVNEALSPVENAAPPTKPRMGWRLTAAAVLAVVAVLLLLRALAWW